MLKAREILRLKQEIGLSLREIGQSVNCGKTAVSEVRERVATVGVSWPIDFSDKHLMSLLYPPINNKSIPQNLIYNTYTAK
jgi:hypothetical protein